MTKISISLHPPSDDVTARAMHLAQQLREHDAALANLLMRVEQSARRGTRKGKRVVFVGKEIRGKQQKFYIDAELLK